jgi:hypothetical protein
MPFKIRKAPKKELYWVVNTANGRKFSNDPIPFENAQGQLRVLERWAEENRDRFHPEETKETRFIQDVVAGMKHGAFTKQAQKHKMGVEEFADYVLEHPDFFTVTTRRRAQFLVNIRKKVKKQSGSGMCCCSRRNARGGVADDAFGSLFNIKAVANKIDSTNQQLRDKITEEQFNQEFANVMPPANGEFFSANFGKKRQFMIVLHNVAVDRLGQAQADGFFPRPPQFGVAGIAGLLGLPPAN